MIEEEEDSKTQTETSVKDDNKVKSNSLALLKRDL